MVHEPLAAPATAEKAPRGYTINLAVAALGLYLALLAPIFGGLSVRIQAIVGIDDAPAFLGLITGVGALFALVCQPLAGQLSDRTMSKFGMRRPWIAAGTAGMVIAILVCAVAPSIPVLLIGWCAAQLFGNVAFAALTATIADQVPESRRGGASGVYGAASPAGILVGALLLAALPTDFLRFAVPAFIALVAGIYFCVVLKDRVRTERPSTPLSLKKLFGSFLFNPRKNPDFAWAWFTKFLVIIGMGGVVSYLTLFLGAAYGMSIEEQLAFNAIANVVYVGSLVIASVFGGRLSDRVGRKKPFIIGSGILIALGAGLASLSAVILGDAGLAMLFVALFFVGVGGGLFGAVDQALCIALLPNPDEVAKDLGVLNVANALGQSVAPFLAGSIVIPIGAALFGTGYISWFVVSALFALVGALLITRIKKVA